MSPPGCDSEAASVAAHSRSNRPQENLRIQGLYFIRPGQLLGTKSDVTPQAGFCNLIDSMFPLFCNYQLFMASTLAPRFYVDRALCITCLIISDHINNLKLWTTAGAWRVKTPLYSKQWSSSRSSFIWPFTGSFLPLTFGGEGKRWLSFAENHLAPHAGSFISVGETCGKCPRAL